MSKTPKKYAIKVNRFSRFGRNYDPMILGPYTLPEAINAFSYTLECGSAYEHEKGNKKINRNPKSFKTLVINLNKASDNSAMSGIGDRYELVETIS